MDSVYLNNSIYDKLLDLISNNQPCVLSTVTETQGSTPQKAGSSAILNKTGLIAGTVGGGVVEHEIRMKAVDVIQSKASCYCRFNLVNDITNEEAAICGGGMNIIMDASPQKHKIVFEELLESHKNRIPGVLVTLCESGPECEFCIQRMWVTKDNFTSVSKQFNADILQVIHKMINDPVQSEFKEFVFHTSPDFEDNFIFLESIVPLPRLIIAGAGHVGKALSHFGKLLDFEVVVWDDRKEYANKKNLPDADKILNGVLHESLEDIVADKETYIVIVTRGHKNDADVLKLFIDSPAAYIGMIGSKRKVAQVREKFIKEGWVTPEKWAEIYTPIGLDIHSKTVQEIALSIAAQMVKIRYVLNKTDG